MFLFRKCLITLSFCSISFALFAQSIDRKATPETKSLYHSLHLLLNKGIMLGHQDDMAYGLNPDSSSWKYVPGRSDIKSVTGDYPAVFGWEMGGIETGAKNNLDGVSFDSIRSYIEQIYNMEGIITISWHQRNPVTGGSAWDSTGDVVKEILHKGHYHKIYEEHLDKLAAFIKTLKGKNGESIPLIFRPFHEINGNWFWWGKGKCTDNEVKELWHFTVHYLRDKKHLHNLLYAYCTDRFWSDSAYLERYPGNKWVDILGWDIYQAYNTGTNQQFIHGVDTMLTMLDNISSIRNKIPALTEFGYNGLPEKNWWTDVFLKALQGHRISYALAWRNAGCENGKCQFYVPFKGQVSAPDFEKLYLSGKMLFLKNIKPYDIYGRK